MRFHLGVGFVSQWLDVSLYELVQTDRMPLLPNVNSAPNTNFCS